MTDAGSVVRSCLDALEAGDSAAALALLDPEVEWRNSGLPTLRGRRAHRALLDMAKRGIGFEVRFHHLAVDADGRLRGLRGGCGAPRGWCGARRGWTWSSGWVWRPRA